MIVVTGGTGKIGVHLVEQLNAANVEYRLIARSPDKVKVAGRGTVVKADLTDKAAMIHACKGADTLFLLTNSEPGSVQLHKDLVTSALTGGVKRVVRLSAAGADKSSPVVLGQWHAETDEWLQQQHLAWTILRPGYFMQNTLANVPTIKKEGAFYGNQGTGKGTMIDARDIAAAAFKVLTTVGHDQKIYELFGSEALSMDDVAAKVGKYLGKTVKYVNLTDEQMKGGLLSAGLPQWLAADYVTMGSFWAKGYMAGKPDHLSSLIGKSRTYDDFLSAFGGAFK